MDKHTCILCVDNCAQRGQMIMRIIASILLSIIIFKK